jgi:hypothetical protein
MSVVSSELGVGSIKRRVTVSLRLFDAVGFLYQYYVFLVVVDGWKERMAHPFLWAFFD